jgi:RND family efflux transporter MFP subunit
LRAAIPKLAVLLLIFGCRSQDPPRYGLEPTRVEVSTIAPEEVAETVRLHGQLTVPAGHLTQLSSLEPGYLTRFFCREGETVKAGQVLAEITAGTTEAQLDAERAKLAQAQARAVEGEARAERTRALLAQGAASSRDEQNAAAEAKVDEAAVAEARAAVAAVERHLARTTIRAPFDGMVLMFLAAVGQALPGAGQPVLEMADVSVLEMSALASSEEASHLALDQPAEVRLDAIPTRTFAAHVSSLAPALDLAAGVIRVRARLDAVDGESGLRLGLWGDIEVLAAKRNGVVKLPLSALQLNEGEPTARVLLLTPDGQHVASREVRLGRRTGAIAEVVSGLAAGDKVVTRGGYGLPDGAQVIVEKLP